MRHMAVRTISTRLALEGESEYRAKVKNINAELALHKSELERLSAQYADSANSMEALGAREAALKGQLESLGALHTEQAAMLNKAAQAQKLYGHEVEQSQKKLAGAQAKLEELKSSTSDSAALQEKLTAEVKKHEQALASAEKKMQQAGNSVMYYQKRINDTERDQAKLNTELSNTEKYIAEAENSVDHCAASIDQYGKQVKQAGDESQNFGGKSKEAVGALAAALSAAGVAAAIREITEALQACVAASMAFESAVTGVFKTVEGTDAQLAAISDGIKQMSTEIPATTTEIAAVAEAAGQLGIATDDVLSFTRVMLDLGESTNLSADQAASALAKFANITGTASSDYERLGSVIVGLGNNFATTEADIVEMSTRLASAGTLAGMTEADILALATAMSSVGIEAEAGGTAMTQTLTAIEKAVASGGEDLEKFAKIAGVSAQTFSTTWKTDAAGAVQSFIAGLGRLDQQGESAVLVLDELGLSGVRQSNMLKSLALASDEMGQALDTAGKAWKENTALTDEANKRYETTESKMKMLENSFNLVEVAIGDSLNPTLGQLAEAGTGAFDWAADFIEQNPWLVQAITGVMIGLGTLAAGVAAYNLIVTIATPLTQAFSAALSACPAVFVTAAIVGLVATLGLLAGSAEESGNKVAELNKELEETKKAQEASKKAFEDNRAAIQEQNDDILAMASTLEVLEKTENKTAAQKAAMLELVDQLNEAVPELSLAYDAQTDSLNMSTEALHNYIEAEARRQLQEETVARMVELKKEETKTTIELTEAQKELAIAEAEMQRIAEQYGNSDKAGYYAEQHSSAYRTAYAEASALKTHIGELNDMLSVNADELADVAAEYNRYGSAAAQAGDETAGFADQAAGAEDKMTGLTDVLGGIETSLANVTAEYDRAREAAKASIDAQIGLFDKLDGAAEQSAEDLIDTLGSQAEYLSQYAENVRKVMEKGLDPEILSELTSEFSEENAKYLAALAEASDDQVERMNRLYRKVQDEKDRLADTMGEAQTGFSEAVSGLQQDLKNVLGGPEAYSGAFRSGQQTALGVADGIRHEQKTAVEAAEELARAVQAAYDNIQDIHSPSRVMARSGRYTVEGLIAGIDESEADLVRRVEELGRQAEKAMHFRVTPEPNQYEQTVSQAAAVAGSLITVERAAGKEDGGMERPLYVNATIQMGGTVLARKLLGPLRQEEQLRGSSLVE